MTVEFRLSQGLEVLVGGQAVPTGFARQRAVLVALLADLGTPVPVDELVERVWGEHLPKQPREALYGYVSRLRGVLAPCPEATIGKHAAGYVLNADPMTVDLYRFEHTVEAARNCDEDARALELYTTALRAWRGEPVPVVDTPWMGALRDRLRQQFKTAELDSQEIALRLGRHTELLPALIRQAREFPLDERVAGQYMLALYRSGRQADALEHYRQVRLRLADELGADPGSSLQELHLRILSAAPELDTSGQPASVSAQVVPRQLPAEPRGFLGRAHELAALSGMPDHLAEDGPEGAVRVLSGGGGVGKTWLALRWAHDHLAEFPDGQLFVNLRGFDPAAEPVSPDSALHGFLTALGVAPAAIPQDADARAALYRSLSADRRLLVVLDNARETAQVLPLLPGGRSSTVLITSRHRLNGLLATHTAQPLPLGVLGTSEARGILARHLGASSLDADPRATEALLRHCAGLPLALAIVASRAAAHPGFPLAGFADELRADAESLDTLDTGELSWNLRAVFSASYGVLDVQAATMFRWLSLAPGADITLPAAAALCRSTRSAARTVLTALEMASLIEQHRPGRYRMHDLTRAYAAELTKAHDTEADRRDALARLFGHYCHVASVAADLFTPEERERRPPIPPVSGPPVTLPDGDAARAWLEAERDNLLASARHAAAFGPATVVTHLSATLFRYLDNCGHYQDALTLHTAARDAVDPAVVAHAHALCSLGYALVRLGRYDEALHELRQALGHPRADPLVDYAANTNIAFVHDDRGDRETALTYYARALDASRTPGYRSTYGIALNNLGDCYRKLGRHEEAIDHLRRSITIAEEFDSAGLGGVALGSLGDLQRAQDDHSGARASYRRALELARICGNPGLEVELLNRLASATVTPREGLEQFQRALSLAREIGFTVEEAHAHHGLARLHHTLGDLTASRNHAHEALRLYTALKSSGTDAVGALIRDHLSAAED
ncbi:BTAD domain-containing putative transcriptional regulator [Amycolatopsis oliviviridis]|uniref:SARP family transcriptional regulator n=1 Tax=Amycolatopsis oliviviridis TaxID=1471590 RepID=A0ABQ3M6W4_9PSEU|nr:BTAD domain-containing putative transcriptional regulator [Amycolatopsis oliviviridis]GHH34440.1 SARP family transcriptional regulator [Amycolatopsis oliviviridis]